MLQLSFIIRRYHTIVWAPVFLMVSLHHTDRAIRVDVFTAPALVTLLLEQAAGLHKVVFPAILAGAFKLS